jgi:hypothetical protein
VLPTDHDRGAATLETWLRVPACIAAIAGAEPDAALPLWLAALPPGPAAIARARLEVVPTAVARVALGSDGPAVQWCQATSIIPGGAAARPRAA